MPLGTWVLSLPSAPAVEHDHDELGVGGRLAHAPLGPGDVRERVGPLVGGEPEQRHALASHRLGGLGARAAGVEQADPGERRDGLALGRRPVVVRVVVGQVHHREARALQPPRVRGGRAEGVAVGAARRRTWTRRRWPGCPRGCPAPRRPPGTGPRRRRTTARRRGEGRRGGCPSRCRRPWSRGPASRPWPAERARGAGAVSVPVPGGGGAPGACAVASLEEPVNLMIATAATTASTAMTTPAAMRRRRMARRRCSARRARRGS